MDMKDQIIEAIKTKDKEKLKELKDQLGRDKWLKVWQERGSSMKDWIELENPFVKFVETE
jgi:uncharacterized protein YpbB